MSVRKMVSRKSICDTAMQIIQDDGAGALSMRTLATKLGIKAPSLYDHVKSRDEVIALVQGASLLNFGDGFANAGPTSRDKILFYRAWALANPNLYPIVFQEKLHRDLLPDGLEQKVLGVVVAAAGGSHVQARAMWAQLHGLVDLELQGRFPNDADLDLTWEHAILSLEAAKKAHLA